MLDDLVARQQAEQAAAALGLSPEEILVALAPRRGPERLLDLLLRTGPYGDGFGRLAGRLSLDELERHPHGLDLGPLQPRIPEVLRTPSGTIELAPPSLLADVPRLRARLGAGDGMVLVGRRNSRSNNSWMHNLPRLVRGRDECTLWVHPADAERLGLVSGVRARVSSRAGVLEAPVEVTDAVMPGVVSLPHGWGHDLPGIGLRVAAQHPGVNANLVADELALDPLSGNAVLNGIPVTVRPASGPDSP